MVVGFGKAVCQLYQPKPYDMQPKSTRIFKNILETLLLTGLALVCVSGFAQGQTAPVPSGSIAISVGVGAGSTLSLGGTTTIPPVSASLDIGLLDRATIGPYLAIAANGDGQGLDYEHMVIGAKGAYHIAVPVPKLDAYAGGMLGYHIYSSSLAQELGAYSFLPPVHRETPSHTAYSAFAGARYLLFRHVRAFAEVGYGVAYVNVGLCIGVRQ